MPRGPRDALARLAGLLPSRGETIGPTAHYTAAVWEAAGLSHPALSTRDGRALHTALRPALAAAALAGAPRLEDFLLARHRIIDLELEEAIAAGRVGQVVEIAAGLSPRGWRMRERHPDLVYVEGELPGMAARKRAALARTGQEHPPRVVELDALSDDGPDSLGALAAGLDPDRGLAVITEGLLNYLDRDAVLALWRRIATAFGRFPAGTYLSDIHLRSEAGAVPRAFATVLSGFVRSVVHLHFADEDDLLAALAATGLADAVVHHPPDFAGRVEGADAPGADLVRIIEAGRPELRGERVVLALSQAEDGPALRAIHRAPEVAEWWGEVDPGFPMEGDERATPLTIRLDGEIVGYAQFSEEPEPDYRYAWVDIYVDPARHREGIATDALTALVAHLTGERGHHRVLIDPALENEAAIRCYEKVGFRPIGPTRSSWRDTSGRWRDSLAMELVVDPVS